jgi:hypothetical protein
VYKSEQTPKLTLRSDLESAEPTTEYIHNHHYRIEDLERELDDAKKDLVVLANHLELMLRLVMLGVVFYGISFIVNSRRPDSEDQVRLGLDTE